MFFHLASNLKPRITVHRSKDGHTRQNGYIYHLKGRRSMCLFLSGDVPSDTSLPSDKPKSHKIAVAFGLSAGSVSVFILVFGLYLWWRQRHNQPTFFDVKDEEVTLGNLRRFQFSGTSISTNNFKAIRIYSEREVLAMCTKGFSMMGSVVVVKRLKDGNAIGGEIQFQTKLR
ncbi:hypothetical protein OIU85_006289 [Salix viminalis]|uniref:Uncharacterized protein n=1 Tax=Salix viminalis TaxID=40686 RepID=A0A9Q0SUB4_SALVM|nr:hypothetical protein OIU85_006289 [Salix viminalis]